MVTSPECSVYARALCRARFLGGFRLAEARSPKPVASYSEAPPHDGLHDDLLIGGAGDPAAHRQVHLPARAGPAHGRDEVEDAEQVVWLIAQRQERVHEPELG